MFQEREVSSYPSHFLDILTAGKSLVGTHPEEILALCIELPILLVWLCWFDHTFKRLRIQQDEATFEMKSMP